MIKRLGFPSLLYCSSLSMFRLLMNQGYLCKVYSGADSV
nr:MAG TPA: hypothetical protein [Caudoviricetes sp.]